MLCFTLTPGQFSERVCLKYQDCDKYVRESKREHLPIVPSFYASYTRSTHTYPQSLWDQHEKKLWSFQWCWRWRHLIPSRGPWAQIGPFVIVLCCAGHFLPCCCIWRAGLWLYTQNLHANQIQYMFKWYKQMDIYLQFVKYRRLLQAMITVMACDPQCPRFKTVESGISGLWANGFIDGFGSILMWVSNIVVDKRFLARGTMVGFPTLNSKMPLTNENIVLGQLNFCLVLLTAGSVNLGTIHWHNQVFIFPATQLQHCQKYCSRHFLVLTWPCPMNVLMAEWRLMLVLLINSNIILYWPSVADHTLWNLRGSDVERDVKV